MFKLKQLFCSHEFYIIGMNQFPLTFSIKIQCKKCGKKMKANFPFFRDRFEVEGIKKFTSL